MNWTYFPKNRKIPSSLLNIVNIFDNCSDLIDSHTHFLNSDDVLKTVTESLIEQSYVVEKSKKDCDKIKMPVLYGENGHTDLSFEVDAFNKDEKIVIEIEAGRAVTNYQFLKDFFEACCMYDAEYLCIALREIYRNSDDYKKACSFFEAMYASDRFKIPLKGILVIGY